jgi:acyl-coenzyme A thioesterase PaaI-like protein
LHAPSGASLLTVSLKVDYLTAAHDGDWLEADATVTRVGRRRAFADGRVDERSGGGEDGVAFLAYFLPAPGQDAEITWAQP